MHGEVPAPQPFEHMRHASPGRFRFAVAGEQVDVAHMREEALAVLRQVALPMVYRGVGAPREGRQFVVTVAFPRRGEAVVRHDVDEHRRHAPQVRVQAANALGDAGKAVAHRVDAAVQAHARLQGPRQEGGHRALHEVADEAAGHQRRVRVSKQAMGEEVHSASASRRLRST